MWKSNEEELFLSLKSSLEEATYTHEQRKEFSNYLYQLLPINQNMFIGFMRYERRSVLSYFTIEFIENNSFEEFVKYDAKSNEKAMKFVNYEMMKHYYEDKALMQKLVNAYFKKYDVIYQNLLNMKSKEALKNYVESMPTYEDYLSSLDMTRISIIFGLDKIGLMPLSRVFQYEFDENEFVEVASQFYITSGKPWVFGKYKFEWEDMVKQNEELLELCKM